MVGLVEVDPDIDLGTFKEMLLLVGGLIDSHLLVERGVSSGRDLSEDLLVGVLLLLGEPLDGVVLP